MHKFLACAFFELRIKNSWVFFLARLALRTIISKNSAKVQPTHRWLWVNVGLRGTTRDKVRQNMS